VTDAAGNFAEASVLGRVRGIAVSKPPLTLTLTTVKKASPGDEVRYAFNIQNNRPTDAGNVVLTATLPSKTSVVSASPPLSSNAQGVVTWQLGTVQRLRKVVVRLTLRVDADASPGTLLTTSATATNAGGDSASTSANVTVVR
jgi:uncharacterized repeat protein (TIGR01451 family)